MYYIAQLFGIIRINQYVILYKFYLHSHKMMQSDSSVLLLTGSAPPLVDSCCTLPLFAGRKLFTKRITKVTIKADCIV